MNFLRVCVFGSRSISDKKKVLEFLERDLHRLVKLNGGRKIEIVTGMAKGPDRFAFEYAKEKNLRYKRFYPDYDRYGKKAPLIRNQKMAKYANEFICFYDGLSKGSLHMMLQIRRKRSNIFRIHFIKTNRYSIWTDLEDSDAVVITTNLFYKTKNGQSFAVMGRGLALQANAMFNASIKYGRLLASGNKGITVIDRVWVNRKQVDLIAFPSKPDFIKVNSDKSNVVNKIRDKVSENEIIAGYLAKSDPDLIKKSLDQLYGLIKEKNYRKVKMPIPGTGAGELDKEIVIDLIKSSKLIKLKNIVYIFDSNGSVSLSEI